MTYAKGTKVYRVLTGAPGTIESGPFNTPDGDVYIVRTENGGVSPVFDGDIAPVTPADPRREVVAKVLSGFMNDSEWRDLQALTKNYWLDEADVILAALDAMEPAPLKVGDKIRYIAESFYVPAGTELIVIEVAGPHFAAILTSGLNNPYAVRYEIDLGSEGTTWERA